jgi:hypothetical protein
MDVDSTTGRLAVASTGLFGVGLILAEDLDFVNSSVPAILAEISRILSTARTGWRASNQTPQSVQGVISSVSPPSVDDLPSGPRENTYSKVLSFDVTCA